MSRVTDTPDLASIMSAYIAGERRDEIAARHGINPGSIPARLRAVGLYDTARAQRRAQREQREQDERQARRDALAARRAAAREQVLTRGQQYAERLKNGETLQSIGDSEGITRERVRQLVAAAGLGDDVTDAREARRTAKTEAEARERAERAARRKFELVEPPHWMCAPRFSDEQMLDALRSWLGAGGTGTGPAWDAERPTESVLAQAYAKRFGTWRRAVELAGGELSAPEREYSRISAEECVRALADFLGDPDQTSGSAHMYEPWSRIHGTPSNATIRNRVGTWTEAKRQALEILAAQEKREIA